MSTKTMRLPPRRVITAPNKRKEREVSQPSAAKAPEPTTSEAAPPSNLLLAGYLAHEFLSKGTLFGKPWPDPTQAEVSHRGPVTGSAKPSEEQVEAEPKEVAEKKMKKDRYVAVANLLKGDNGTHLPGIVNPTQLANFLQL